MVDFFFQEFYHLSQILQNGAKINEIQIMMSIFINDN